ncbi:hypothetical protein LINPERHAP1_LOCUS43477 [Linum perenne]
MMVLYRRQPAELGTCSWIGHPPHPTRIGAGRRETESRLLRPNPPLLHSE